MLPRVSQGHLGPPAPGYLHDDYDCLVVGSLQVIDRAFIIKAPAAAAAAATAITNAVVIENVKRPEAERSSKLPL